MATLQEQISADEAAERAQAARELTKLILQFGDQADEFARSDMRHYARNAGYTLDQMQEKINAASEIRSLLPFIALKDKTGAESQRFKDWYSNLRAELLMNAYVQLAQIRLALRLLSVYSDRDNLIRNKVNRMNWLASNHPDLFAGIESSEVPVADSMPAELIIDPAETVKKFDPLIRGTSAQLARTAFNEFDRGIPLSSDKVPGVAELLIEQLPKL